MSSVAPDVQPQPQPGFRVLHDLQPGDQIGAEDHRGRGLGDGRLADAVQDAVDADIELLAAEGPASSYRRPAGNGLRGGHPALALGFGQAPAPGLGAGREAGAGAAWAGDRASRGMVNARQHWPKGVE